MGQSHYALPLVFWVLIAFECQRLILLLRQPLDRHGWPQVCIVFLKDLLFGRLSKYHALLLVIHLVEDLRLVVFNRALLWRAGLPIVVDVFNY